LPTFPATEYVREVKWIYPRTVLTAVALLLFVACKPQTTTPKPSATNNLPAAAPKPKPQFARLLGRWERADGGYVLELRSVDAAGAFEAGYFNPQPIRIERAMAVVESSVTKVFVVLRDVNYPGCTYTLTYDDQADQLFGQYYQAALQQTFDVTFGRQKPARP
jgi:hypothetical protein